MRLEQPAPAERRPLTPVAEPTGYPGPSDLLLRVLACAVCRTDLQIAEGEIEPHRPSIIPGHQAVGVVEEVGAGVSGWASGDIAGVGWLAGTCGMCRFCGLDRENLCVDAIFTGWDVDGGYARHMTIRADFALKIPEGFDPVSGAPLLCGGVIGYRSLKLSGVRPDGRLGLYGFGASAGLTMQVALHWGCQVYVATRTVEDQRRAIEMGAVWAGSYDTGPPEPLDVAITFAPSGDVVLHALRAVDRGGTVAVNAIHLDRVPAFQYEWLWWEREIRSVANYTRADAREFLDLAATIPLRTTYQTYDLAQANEALLDLKQGKVAGTAVLLCDG